MANNVQSIRTWRDDLASDAESAVTGPPDDPSSVARALRAAANARYEEFVSSGVLGGQPPVSAGDGGAEPSDDACRDFSSADHNFDLCVRDRVPNSVLFQKEPGDTNAVDANDVRQGRLGDCHLLAPLAALASTPQGRAVIGGAVVENKNDKGVVVSWTVTLHQPETHLLGRTTFQAVRVTVESPYTLGHARPRPGDNQNEVWPLVLEKAYAQLTGGYNNIARGGRPTDAISALTGREATYVSLEWPGRLFRSYGGDDLKADLANGKIVVLSTKEGIGGYTGNDATPAEIQANINAHRLMGSHAYYVQGIEQHDGKDFVKLGNPWADNEPDLVPVDELTTWFSGVSTGSVP